MLFLSNRYLLLTALAVLSCDPGSAQTFDSSGNATLRGSYYVRELLVGGQSADGTITTAFSAIGVAVFDGAGNYTFTGVGTSAGLGSTITVSENGTYSVAANGLMRIGSVLAPGDTAFGGVSALGPSAFVASATEGTSVEIMVGVPQGSAGGASLLSGAYTAGAIDFPNANIGMVRQAIFTGTADGAGNFGSIAVSGKAANLGGTPVAQTVSNVTYSLSASGAGTLTFGSNDLSQLISGTENIYVSADHNLFIGGSPSGFDLMVGIKSIAQATNATSSGEYFLAGIENFAGTPQQGGNAIDGFYGSANANGAGTSIFHYRYQSFVHTVFDYTFDSQYTVAGSPTFTPSDIPYQIALGNNGQAFVASGTGQLYSLVVGFGAPHYSNTGLYLNPLGVVNAASFAPITNPIAPGELLSLYGSGFSTSTTQAQSLPLPVSLGGVQVTINAQPAPLFYVSPTQIVVLAPSTIGPSSGVAFATVQVLSGTTASNSVTVYTNNTAPGVFSATGNGVGPAAAQLGDYSLLSSVNPATPGKSVVLYYSGGGTVSPAPQSGAAAPSSPLATVVEPTLAYFGGDQGLTTFAGLTPGLAGLYQLNSVVPSDPGAGSLLLEVSTLDAYTSETRVSVAPRGSVAPDAHSGARRNIMQARNPGKATGLATRGVRASAAAR